MLNVNSSGHGYPVNWLHICDTCTAAASTLYCPTDSAYLCNSCNECIHAANSMALQHECARIFTACENERAASTAKTSAALLCVSCDADTNLANTLAHDHVQVPVPHFSSLFYAPSSTYLEELPDTMLDTENEISAPTTATVDQDETGSWLLLEPDNNDNQTNSGFTYGEEIDESFGIMEYNSCNEYQHRYQIHHQQLYCAHQGDDGNDGAVPVQSSEMKEQEEQQQQQQQHQQQQLRNMSFNRDYGASETTFMNAPSSSQIVPMSGILPKATVGDISSSYTGYPQEATNIFPKFSFLMPLQFTSMNREAKVLRYREKRKARKFEKKVRYASRKAYAEARPRVKGRFARKTEMDFEVDEMFSTEDFDYGIVPSG